MANETAKSRKPAVPTKAATPVKAKGTAKSEVTTKLKVTQVRSRIGSRASQRDTLTTLGLRRINDTVVKQDRPEIRGMVATVAHLVTVEEVK
ncbi:MAG: 50S ribosomal protein L30 [Acidimicrobiales bacterium]|nr:MAG: 50S ribosomal protein L30 [Acidimicrobiales bacterium]